MGLLREPWVQVAPENSCGITVQHLGIFDSCEYPQMTYCLEHSTSCAGHTVCCAPKYAKFALAGSCSVGPYLHGHRKFF